MDRVLIDYVQSGRAWLLIGSGPSSEMGYPSWKALAETAERTVMAEAPSEPRLTRVRQAIDKGELPLALELASDVLGAEALDASLSAALRPKRAGKIYDLLARWPVPVYLTTNYDDEISAALTRASFVHNVYGNSTSDLALLDPELQGAVFKLHGDLGARRAGRILTKRDYAAIQHEPPWEYWRTKLTSIFQLHPTIIVGHSLTDPNFKHVLEAARKGASVQRPICWISPDPTRAVAKEYLEKYRIRVVPYDNETGDHSNLLRLIESITQFAQPRTSIRIERDILRISEQPLEAAAAGFHVFSRMAATGESLEQRRVSILVAGLQAVLPKLQTSGQFTVTEALELAGWPAGVPVPEHLSAEVIARAIDAKLVARVGDRLQAAVDGLTVAREGKAAFEHLRALFLQSLVLKLRRKYVALSADQAQKIAEDVEASLVGYFKECGLSLATTLFSLGTPARGVRIPASIVSYLTQASARYPDPLRRQAFATTAIDLFTEPEAPERAYLGRISQGFFAFHALGVYGDSAKQQLEHAKQTVWIIDSSAQIPALAVHSAMHAAFLGAFHTCKKAGIRLFTTESLFDETFAHFQFAQNVVREHGAQSRLIVAAAIGQTPYKQANQFLEGFIQWRAEGNPADWEKYLYQLFKSHTPGRDEVRASLKAMGIETVGLNAWPGFRQEDYAERDEVQSGISKLWDKNVAIDADDPYASLKKAKPEAEAVLIVRREREGKYYILSNASTPSSAWFVSQTSIIGLLGDKPRTTWQPESFVRFISTLGSAIPDDRVANQAFETILMSVAQSGLSLLDERSIETVFGGVVDQTRLQKAEVSQEYQRWLEQTYSESQDAILARLRPSVRVEGAVQLANQFMEQQGAQLKTVSASLAEEQRKVRALQRELDELKHFKSKLEAKRDKAKRRKRSSKGKRR